MTNVTRQRGLSYFSLAIILAVAGFFVVVGLKLFPVYMESFQVDTALKNIVSQPSAANMSTRDVYDKFLRHMEINNISRFSERNLKSHLKIERGEGTVRLIMTYEAQAELFGNLSILADWHKEFSN